MALIAIAVTLGTPNSAGQVPITVSDLAAEIAQAVTDTTALAAVITTVQTDAATADTDAATVVTDTTNADTDAGTVVTDIATTGTDFDTFAAALIAITGDTYNSTTKQFTYGGATGLTHAQIAGALGTDLNAIGAAIVAAATAAATAKTATAAAVTAAGTAKTATALTVTDATPLSTATIAADHTAAQAIIASANVFIQSDGSVVTNVALLNGALVSALTFVRDSAIIPT
jgi:hypothetical protein